MQNAVFPQVCRHGVKKSLRVQLKGRYDIEEQVQRRDALAMFNLRNHHLAYAGLGGKPLHPDAPGGTSCFDLPPSWAIMALDFGSNLPDIF